MLPFWDCSGTTFFLDCFLDTVFSCFFATFEILVPEGSPKCRGISSEIGTKLDPSAQSSQRGPESGPGAPKATEMEPGDTKMDSAGDPKMEVK